MVFQPRVESFWPVTVTGWVTLCGFALMLAGSLVGWGMALQRYRDQQKQLKEIQERVDQLIDPERVDIMINSFDALLKDFVEVHNCLWGPKSKDGNGLYRQVKALDGKMDEVLIWKAQVQAVSDDRARQGLEERRQLGSGDANKSPSR